MSLRALKRRASYFLWAAGRRWGTDRSCPACGNKATVLLKRKWGVTALYCCPSCGLRFRTPKDDLRSSAAFYKNEYEEGSTTSLPSEDELQRLLRKEFRGHEKDFRPYIDVLRAAGLQEGALIFDFGASWGYGSWQFRKAGFRTIGYELDPVRARYASERLGVTMMPQPGPLPEAADCFFSSHVIEHLPNPNILWETGVASLKPRGWLVAFTPNGDPSQESAAGSGRYHKLWGQAHPLLITPGYLRAAASRYGFDARVYSAPYPLEAISRGSQPDSFPGWELCVVARKAEV